jgi:hypothetical protein
MVSASCLTPDGEAMATWENLTPFWKLCWMDVAHVALETVYMNMAVNND